MIDTLELGGQDIFHICLYHKILYPSDIWNPKVGIRGHYIINYTINYTLFSFFFDIFIQEGMRIRTSDLRFMRYGLQPIELLLGDY
jgi:hypothetical protein